MSFRGSSVSFSSSSMTGGIGSRGSMFGAISPATIGNLANAMRPYVQVNSSTFPQADDKETMKGLNDRLAGYLSKVRLLEESNNKLEEQIKEALMRKGVESGRDWSDYEKTIAALRKQIQEMTMDNARLFLQIDNARLASDDFKVKFESEQAMRQGVEQDLARLRKMLDDTYMGRMQLESQIESMREELAFLKKNHEEDVANLMGQISDSQVNVQMETKNSADLNDTIDNIRKQYERAAQKSREETEAWYKNKFDNITAEVTQNTEALQAGKSELNELRRQKQSLEIDLQALHNMIRSLENSLHETEMRYGQEVGGHNSRILQLEGELGQMRAQMENQAAEYEALLNVKTKLEAEIATYHRLLEGVVDDKGDKIREDFSLEQALYAAPPPPPPPQSVGLKKSIIITQELVDGQVVSQSEVEKFTSYQNNHDVLGEKVEETEQLKLAEEEELTKQEQELVQEVFEEVLAEEEELTKQEQALVQEVFEEVLAEEEELTKQEQELVQEVFEEVLAEEEELTKQELELVKQEVFEEVLAEEEELTKQELELVKQEVFEEVLAEEEELAKVDEFVEKTAPAEHDEEETSRVVEEENE